MVESFEDEISDTEEHIERTEVKQGKDRPCWWWCDK